jgi:hypothetical protein
VLKFGKGVAIIPLGDNDIHYQLEKQKGRGETQ